MLIAIREYNGAITLNEVLDSHPILKTCIVELWNEKANAEKKQIRDAESKRILNKMKG